MKIDIDNGMIINAETGEDIKPLSEMTTKECIEFMYLLVSERDELIDTILDKDYRIEELEQELEMFEDNLGIEE